MSKRDKSIEVLVGENPSFQGLQVSVKAGPEREPIKMDQDPAIVDWQEIRPGFKFLHLRRVRQYHCGHRGPSRFRIRVYGRTLIPSRKHQGKSCPDCSVEEVKKEAIRCCLCGRGIIPGEAVAIYDPRSIKPKDFEFTIVDDAAVGCMLWDCAPSGGFFAGHWNGKGITYYDWTGKSK